MKRTAFIAGTSALAVAGSPARAAGPLVLTGATVVDVTTGALAPHRAIVIERGTIAKIVPASAVPTGATVVDLHGGYVVPGYNDFHAHPLSMADPDGALALMLAHGITGFRQLSGSASMLAARAKGPLTGANQPAVLEMPGEPLTPGNAPTPDAARALVAQQQAQGADFIKAVGLAGEPFRAALDEARTRKLRFIGHLATSEDVRATLAAGMTSIEHLGPRDAMLIGCSTQEDAIRAAIRPAPPGGPGPASPTFVSDSITLPTLFTSAPDFPRYRQVIATYSAERMRDLAAHFVRANAWTVPTLIRLRTMFLALDPAYANDPALAYVPRSTIATWKNLADLFRADVSSEQQTVLADLFTALLGLVRPMKSAGVAMLAGSDTGGEWIVPGQGLHQEFDLLAQAGLTPLEILQMTTIDGARFLGRTATMGTVAPGRAADLVVLRANPLERVANLHAVTGVVRGGAYYDRAALERLTLSVAQKLVRWDPPAVAPCCSGHV